MRPPDLWKWIFIPFCTVVIIIIGVIIICKVTDQPPQPAPEPNLVVADAHAAVWMPVDNAFTYVGSQRPYWEGVLFQLGEFWRAEGDSLFTSPYEAVVLEDASGAEQTLPNGTFTWINIVADRGPGVAPPISTTEFKEIGHLYPDAGTPTVCDPVDACAVTRDPTDVDPKCLCSAGAQQCPRNSRETIPRECMRLRTIRTKFQPNSAITYWQGDRGFDMKAYRAGPHNKFEFYFNDPFAVQIFNQKNPVPITIGKVTKITIKMHDDPNHGEVHAPPIGGRG